MHHHSSYNCDRDRKSRTKSLSPVRKKEKNYRRHHRSPSKSLSQDFPSKSTPSSSTTFSKSQKELAPVKSSSPTKITRKIYNANIEQGSSGNSKKFPKQIRRAIDDPQQIGVLRRFGEGTTPLFDRNILKTVCEKTDQVKSRSTTTSSSESSPRRRRSVSPNNGSSRNRRFNKNDLEKSTATTSFSRQSRSIERRLYNKDKKKKSASSPTSKPSYFLDTKREEDRIRQKQLDDRKKRHPHRSYSRSRSRERTSRKYTRRRSRERSRSRSISRSRSRSSRHAMMAVHPYPIAYYPPPYPYPAPFLPMDPWRPYHPYPFPPRPPYPPAYMPRPRIPGAGPFLPNVRSFRPRFNRR